MFSPEVVINKEAIGLVVLDSWVLFGLACNTDASLALPSPHRVEAPLGECEIPLLRSG